MATTTTTGSSPSASITCRTSAQYELPVHDAACGVPNSSIYKPIIESCAKPAGLRAYNDGCALYALAVDQSVQDLTDCLYKAGVSWEDVWCFGLTNATATATSYQTAAATDTLTATSNDEASTATAASTSTSSSTPNSAPVLASGRFSVNSALIVSTVFVSAVLCCL